MTSADDRALVLRIASEIWNRGELGVVDEVMAADAVYHGPHMPGDVGDREMWREHIARTRDAFPDSHVTFEELIPCDGTVVGRWTARGTHRGDLPGLPASGTRIEVGGITIYRIRGGKIVEAWEQLDLLGMWEQLGVVSVPGSGD